MQASELIAALQKGIDECGDLWCEGYNIAGDLTEISGVTCCNNYAGNPRFVVTPDHDDWAE